METTRTFCEAKLVDFFLSLPLSLSLIRFVQIIKKSNSLDFSSWKEMKCADATTTTKTTGESGV